MTLPNRQLFWIARLRKRRAGSHLVRASAVRSAAGRPAKKTDGLVAAETNGTLSIPGASALPASISGLRLSAFLVAGGRRTRIGTRRELEQVFAHGLARANTKNSPVNQHTVRLRHN